MRVGSGPQNVQGRLQTICNVGLPTCGDGIKSEFKIRVGYVIFGGHNAVRWKERPTQVFGPAVAREGDQPDHVLVRITRDVALILDQSGKQGGRVLGVVDLARCLAGIGIPPGAIIVHAARPIDDNDHVGGFPTLPIPDDIVQLFVGHPERWIPGWTIVGRNVTASCRGHAAVKSVVPPRAATAFQLPAHLADAAEICEGIADQRRRQEAAPVTD